MAGELGTDFAFAHFLAPDQAEGALAAYRGLLAGRNAAGGSPGVLAVRAVTAESEAEAEALAHSVVLWRARKDLGEDLPLPPARAARNHRWTSLEAERAYVRERGLVWGTPEQVHTRLAALAEAYAVEEVMVNTLTCDPADRLRSYRLLTEVRGATVQV
ncbi:hypothetical protein ACPCB7_02460 [Streptomyces arboris]